ncbi:uncharacterized protein LOC115884359 [Sitophilus oryzae]|uniref:Uncharacterized protein LOC115884359 n=1 Tax=Sitophilus oryzae TaxID=7048 RepID=A0A6J2Y6C3_SITOR|nr:uncharacterized protein LOC115884359 [Sitophilus oryzae]
MNQLSGKYVNVVLSVGDGKSMDFVKHPIHIEANFNGRILESDKLVPEESISFNTELIWEADKKELRKLRSSNQPLRVECISVDPQNRRDRIGFVLMSLRSAQVISLKDAKTPVNFKWCKLIGCQADKKKHHPELYLGISIRDHMLNDHEEEVLEDMPLISEGEPNQITEDAEFSSEFPLKYLEDGFIQIGDEEDEYESFSLNLLVKEARNLDALLPEALVFRQAPDKYHLTFKIFGVTIKTKPFYKQLQGIIYMNEKVVIRILSSEQTLFEFFKTQNIGIILFHGHELLGFTEIELSDVTFEETEGKCLFKLPPPSDVVPFGGDDALPYIEVVTWVKRSQIERVKKVVSEEKIPTKVVMSNLDKAIFARGGGDYACDYASDTVDNMEMKIRSECRVLDDDTYDVTGTKSAETVIKNVPMSPRPVKKYDVLGDYVRNVLHVSLQNFVWRVAAKDRIVMFKFLHPRASNGITIFTQISNEAGVTTDLKNIGAKLSYVSTDTQIENILNAWPPKLVLTDEKERLLSEEYEFDVSKFLGGFSKLYKYTADLKAIRTFQPLARVEVTLNLEDAAFNLDDTDFHLNPPIIDEVLTLKEISDIETWKKTQKELFNCSLEDFKESEAKKLETTWQEKKIDIEMKLDAQMNKCKHLQEELQNKLDSIKTEKYLTRTRNQANIFSEIFNENWDKYCCADTKELIELLSKTQRDNEYLKKLVADQRDKLRSFEKTALTKGQTVALLQELKELEKGYAEVQNAKEYFKTQWKQACDEIHELKTEEYKKIQLEIKKSKEELGEFNLNNEEEIDVINKLLALNEEHDDVFG